MSGNIAEKSLNKSIVTISQNPEVYLTEMTLVIKDKEYPREEIWGCRVEEVESFGEADLYYSNEEGPGKVAFKGLNFALKVFGKLNIFRDFSNTGDNSSKPVEQTSIQDANPPLYCLALLTDRDEILVLPSINRLLLLEVAAGISRELAFDLEKSEV